MANETNSNQTNEQREYTVEDLVTIQGCDVDEQETVVNFLRSEDKMIIYTRDNTVVTTLRKKMIDSPNAYKLIKIYYFNGQPTGYTFEAPKTLLSFRNEIILSDEDRQKRSERMRKIASKN